MGEGRVESIVLAHLYRHLAPLITDTAARPEPANRGLRGGAKGRTFTARGEGGCVSDREPSRGQKPHARLCHSSGRIKRKRAGVHASDRLCH